MLLFIILLLPVLIILIGMFGSKKPCEETLHRFENENYETQAA